MSELKNIKLFKIIIILVVIFSIFTFFVVLGKKTLPFSTKKDDVIKYEQKDLGFGLKIPETWKGKYIIEESVIQDTRYINYYTNDKNKWLVFGLIIYPENVWQNIKDPKILANKEKIISLNGSAIVLMRPDRVPNTEDEYNNFNKLSADIDQIAKSLFQTGQYNARSINIYFSRNSETDCRHVEATQRVLDHRGDFERGALTELLAGPTPEEREQGFSSFFSSQTANSLKGFKIINGIAYINLNDIRQLIPNASTSCGSAQILAQINTTMKQFVSIIKIVIAIQGKPKDFYEWLQFDCPDKESCDETNFQTIN